MRPCFIFAERMMKTCSKCGETKPLSDYHNKKSIPGGKAYQCKECVNRMERERRVRDGDRIRQVESKYRDANRSAKSDINKRYRQKNKTVLLQREKEYREANRDAINERCRKYHHRNKDEINAKHRKRYALTRPAQIEKGKKYREKNREKIRTKSKKHQKRYSDNLSDTYIKALLKAHGSSLVAEDIPPELIIMKRAQLKLYRALVNE